MGGVAGLGPIFHSENSHCYIYIYIYIYSGRIKTTIMYVYMYSAKAAIMYIFESEFRDHCAKQLDGALRKPASFM